MDSKHKIWNEKTEKVIIDIQNACKDYKYMHVEACKTASRKYDITMYIIIALGPISSILASTYDTSLRCNSESNQIVQIFLSLISGVLSAIIKFSKFEHQATVHRATSLKFASLENNIKRQLTLLPEDRQSADKYLEWVTHSFDELFNSSPIIVETVFKKWSKEQDTEQQPSQPVQLCQEHTLAGNEHTLADNEHTLAGQDRSLVKDTSPEAKTDTKTTESLPSPRPQYPLEELEYNSFSDGKMNYELARFRKD
jgi:hypothetical protein